MEITRHILCELPFILNLPAGDYDVPLPSGVMTLQVIHGLFATHLAHQQFAIASAEAIRTGIPNYQRYHHQPLRTVLRHTLRVDVPQEQLPACGEAELIEDITAEAIRDLRGEGGPEGADAEGRRRLEALGAEERERRCLHGAVRRYTNGLLPNHREFLDAINVLIRLYMQRFNDFFVEGIGLHQLASQFPLLGVYIEVVFGGEIIEHHGVVGLVPPIMRGPWFEHPADNVERFRTDLAAGIAPDPVGLLGVRARSLLLRAAYRSAIVEASAALDLSLSRKIRQGFRLQGVPDKEIDTRLGGSVNQRFDERAKRILRDATGKSAADFDNSLWERVNEHRKTLRQGASHGEAEPTEVEARAVVDDFLALVQHIEGITLAGP